MPSVGENPPETFRTSICPRDTSSPDRSTSVISHPLLPADVHTWGPCAEPPSFVSSSKSRLNSGSHLPVSQLPNQLSSFPLGRFGSLRGARVAEGRKGLWKPEFLEREVSAAGWKCFVWYIDPPPRTATSGMSSSFDSFDPAALRKRCFARLSSNFGIRAAAACRVEFLAGRIGTDRGKKPD